MVEAKQADLTKGFVQLAVELIALQIWLAKKELAVPPVLTGCVTTGDIWHFGQHILSDALIVQDLALYRVPEDLEELAALLKGVVTLLSPLSEGIA